MRYNTPNTPLDNVRDFVTRGGIPVTITLLAISILLFLAMFFTNGAVAPFVTSYVAFTPANVFHAPWTIFTYPVVGGNFIGLLIGGFFMWLAGGSLERSWGSSRFAIFFFALSAISALSLLLGYFFASHTALPAFLLSGGPLMMYGFSLPLSGLIVAFCMLNPQQTVMLFFFPLRAIYVAWIIALWTYFSGGMGPLLNLFACGGIIAAFLYVRFGRSWADVGSYNAPRRNFRGPDLGPNLRMDTRPQRPTYRTTLDGSPQRRSPMDVAGRLKDWQERRRLERLWKNSGLPREEPDWRDDEKRRR